MSLREDRVGLSRDRPCSTPLLPPPRPVECPRSPRTPHHPHRVGRHHDAAVTGNGRTSPRRPAAPPPLCPPHLRHQRRTPHRDHPRPHRPRHPRHPRHPRSNPPTPISRRSPLRLPTVCSRAGPTQINTVSVTQPFFVPTPTYSQTTQGNASGIPRVTPSSSEREPVSATRDWPTWPSRTGRAWPTAANACWAAITPTPSSSAAISRSRTRRRGGPGTPSSWGNRWRPSWSGFSEPSTPTSSSPERRWHDGGPHERTSDELSRNQAGRPLTAVDELRVMRHGTTPTEAADPGRRCAH